MTPTLHPYPAHNPSGIPWLGDVPAHWEVRRGHWLFRKMNRPVCDADEVITCFRDGTVTLRKNRRMEGFTESLKEIGYQGIRKGDLVIHQMDSFAGAVGVADSDGKGTPVYSVCNPTHQANPFYYAHIVREMARCQWILALAKGIRERSTDFRYSEFAQQALPIPPLPEQAAIVRYLDHADRRIRRYVRAKERLIALLAEERQAVVNRAVTRGLDPNAPLKPSGIPWLGDIPAHWEVLALKRLGVLKSGVGFPIEQQGHQDQEISFFKVSDMNLPGNDIFMNTRNNSVSRNTAATLKATIFPVGTIIFPKVGGAMLTNKRRVLTHPSSIDNNLMGCIVTRGDSDFTLLLLRHIDLAVIAKPGPVPAISEGELGDVRVALPPLAEQRAIVERLDKATAAIDAAAARACRQIELLQEYRTRLIADVVTGKLDVRHAAAQLAEEADEQPVRYNDAEKLAHGRMAGGPERGDGIS